MGGKPLVDAQSDAVQIAHAGDSRAYLIIECEPDDLFLLCSDVGLLILSEAQIKRRIFSNERSTTSTRRAPASDYSTKVYG